MFLSFVQSIPHERPPPSLKDASPKLIMIHRGGTPSGWEKPPVTGWLKKKKKEVPHHRPTPLYNQKNSIISTVRLVSTFAFSFFNIL